MNLGEYFARLAALHDAMRDLADTGDEQVEVELMALGLQTVTG